MNPDKTKNEWTLVTNKKSKKKIKLQSMALGSWSSIHSKEKITIKCNGQTRIY